MSAVRSFTGQRPASAASGGSAKRSWADEFYEDAPQLPPLPAAADFPTLGGGSGGGAIGGAWGNASRLKSSCEPLPHIVICVNIHMVCLSCCGWQCGWASEAAAARCPRCIFMCKSSWRCCHQHYFGQRAPCQYCKMKHAQPWVWPCRHGTAKRAAFLLQRERRN